MPSKEILLNDITKDFAAFDEASQRLQASIERAAHECPGDTDIALFVKVVREIGKATVGILLASLVGETK